MAAELTQKSEKIVKLLYEAALKKNTARIIVYLHTAGEADSRKIERSTGLRQPEVSLAMKELKNWGWAKEKEIKKKGKGRPLKSFKLATDFKEVIREMVDKKKEEQKKAEKELQELENLF